MVNLPTGFTLAADMPRQPGTGVILLPGTSGSTTDQFKQVSSKAWADDLELRHEASELAQVLGSLVQGMDRSNPAVDASVRHRLGAALDRHATLARHGEIGRLLHYAAPIDFEVEHYHDLVDAARDLAWHPGSDIRRRRYAGQAAALFYKVLDTSDTPFVTHTNPMTTGIAEWALERAIRHRIGELLPGFDPSLHAIRRAVLRDVREVSGVPVGVTRHPDVCVTGPVHLRQGWTDEVLPKSFLSLESGLFPSLPDSFENLINLIFLGTRGRYSGLGSSSIEYHKRERCKVDGDSSTAFTSSRWARPGWTHSGVPSRW